MNIIVPILAAAAQIAAVLINGQLANPVPSPPAVSQTLAVQNELVANIAKALTQASIIITITNGAVSIASQLIGPVINLLSSICNNETFNVNQDTKNALNADTELSVVDTDSEFYR